MTGSGVDAAYEAPRFSNMSLDDAIAIVFSKCYIGMFDASSYYEIFVFAPSFVMEKNIAFRFVKIIYLALAILFVFYLAPAFCAAYTAELLTVAYNDDWLTVEIDESKESCEDNMMALITMYEGIGLKFPERKRQLNTDTGLDS